jgi:hypothetical protein
MSRDTDYRRTKPAALQQLAARGDRAAVRELERRGIAAQPHVDVTTLDARTLRDLVLAWRAGATPEERAQNRARAVEAQAELQARYRADRVLYERHGGRPPRDVPAAPWDVPRPPRTQDWQRPTDSKCYPRSAWER